MKHTSWLHDLFHDLGVKFFLVDTGEDPERDIPVARDADSHEFYVVAHLFGQGT